MPANSPPPFDAVELNEIADALQEHLDGTAGLISATSRQRIRELRDRARLLAADAMQEARRSAETARLLREREPTDDEVANGHGMEGGISFVASPWDRARDAHAQRHDPR